MTVELAYRIVDVFTDRPLAGNALCVVLDPTPDAVQQAIAREVNLSETTFPVVTGDQAYDMRIFTPESELPFAGHPSLGTAWALGPGRWTQTTAGATVVVEADRRGAVMTQPDPVLSSVDPGAAVAAVGLAGAEGAALAEAAGMRHLLVATESAIDGLDPDPARVAAVTRRAGASTLAVVRRRDDRTLHVRVFAPAEGIPEDPGTGAAAGPIGAFALRHWGTDVDVTILQGLEIGRPSRIEVHAAGGAIRVGGSVADCATGRFTLSTTRQ
ncbi:MAG TPA: PhzF family phenazine biosynthesis protein [Acidimicrobiales bacterium]|nr:PhzF family phenazine biosynthesis protein [Acidimicrobiales bacterium]